MQLRHVPNALCVVRLAMIPVLWGLALRVPEAKLLFAALLGFAYLTDQVDGYLCRRYGLSTPFGAKFDRICDDLLTLNAAVWVCLLRPELHRNYLPVLLILVGAFALSVVLQLARFGRKIPFHLYAGKLSNWIIALFAIHTIVFGPTAWTVYLMAAFVGYALLEEIVLVATRRELDEHVATMFSRRA